MYDYLSEICLSVINGQQKQAKRQLKSLTRKQRAQFVKDCKIHLTNHQRETVIYWIISGEIY